MLTFSLSVFATISIVVAFIVFSPRTSEQDCKRAVFCFFQNRKCKGQLSSTGTCKKLIFRLEPVKDNKLATPILFLFSLTLSCELPVKRVDYGTLKNTHLGFVWIFHRVLESLILPTFPSHYFTLALDFSVMKVLTMVFTLDAWTLASILEE